jgi:hypothetical protein
MTKQQQPVIVGACRGHVLARGKLGFEAFDIDDRSLGVFPTQDAAINAIDRESISGTNE